MEYPADKLLNVKLNNNWVATKKIVYEDTKETKNFTCYEATNGLQKGFLKAFDYRDLKKSGGKDKFNHINGKIQREIKLLKKCNKKQIENVVALIEEGEYFFIDNDINTLVNYFILEFSDGGNIEECLKEESIEDLEVKFYVLSDIFLGVYNLHKNEIIHLDIKTTNLLFFINDNIAKIGDFGSARQIHLSLDEDEQKEYDNIKLTRMYAPPEFLYRETDVNWFSYRRKIDLYLLGNVIVKLFTNFSFTAMMTSELPEYYHWSNEHNHGQLKNFMDVLITSYVNCLIKIKEHIEEINEKNGTPLNLDDIAKIITIIKELCHPDPSERGDKKSQMQNINYDGLDRYSSKFITLAKKVSYRSRKAYKLIDKNV